MDNLGTKLTISCIDVILPVERLLRISGIWPTKEVTTLYRLRTAISWALAYILLAMMFAEVVHVIGDIGKVNEIACTLTPITVYCFKMMALAYYRTNFFNILDTLNSGLFNSFNETMDKPLQEIMKVTTKTSRLFQIMTLCVLSFYAIFPILDKKDLPVPFTFNVGGYIRAIYILQICGLSLCAWNLTSIDLLFVNFMGIAAAIIDTLRKNVAGIMPDMKTMDCGNMQNIDMINTLLLSRNTTKSLRKCCMLHRSILNYLNDVETIFSFSMLVHYLTTIVLICSSLLQLTTLVDVHSIQFVLSCMFVVIVLIQCFLYHWFVNEVIIKSMKIGEACYLSNCYQCDVKVQKTLLMLMMGSQKPLGITAYKFTFISLASFLTIIRWSYSFAALIRTRYILE